MSTQSVSSALHPSFATQVSCSACGQTCDGELHIADISNWSEWNEWQQMTGLSKIVGYQCPNCGNIFCAECDKKYVKHGFWTRWDKKKSFCPMCHDSLYPGPRKMILQVQAQSQPMRPLCYEVPTKLEQHLSKTDRFICLAQVVAGICLLTDTRLLLVDHSGRQVEASFPLTSIQAIDVVAGSRSGRGIYTLQLSLQAGQAGWERIERRDLDFTEDQEQMESFALEILRASSAKFAVPLRQSGKGAEGKELVEFYPKKSLRWPQKCAVCLSEENLGLETRKIEQPPQSGSLLRGITTPVGPLSFVLPFPLCQPCIKQRRKGIDMLFFNGARVVARFHNRQYAQEFIELNKETYIG